MSAINDSPDCCVVASYFRWWIGLLDIRNGTAAKICGAVEAGVR
jgi:hypothetical protein